MFFIKWVNNISIFFLKKNQNPIRCVMGLKVGCVLILWLGLETKTPKSNEHSLEFGTTFV